MGKGLVIDVGAINTTCLTRGCLFAAFLFCAGAPVFAQSFQVVAEADPADVVVGQQFIYQVSSVLTGETSNAPAPDLPLFPDFTVVGESGPSTSSMTHRDNWRTTHRITVTRAVKLMASTEGTFKIAPAQATYQGKVYKSKEVTIRVSKSPAGNLSASLGGEEPLYAQTNSNDLNKQLIGHLFLQPEVSNSEPYEGQPVIVTYYAYSNLSEQQLGPFENMLYPELTGLSGKDFQIYEIANIYTPRGQMPGRLSKQRIDLDGKLFSRIKVLQAACVPKKSGMLLLGPYHLGARINVGGRDPFGEFFGGSSIFGVSGVKAVMPTLPLEVRVKPLPAEGRPADFANIIGDYELSVEADRSEMSEEDLLTVTMELSGHGATNAIGALPLPEMDGFEVYSEKSDSDMRADADGLAGSKTSEYVLRAKRPGNLEIPGISVSVFNPSTGQYEQLTAAPVSVKVAPSEDKLLLIAQGAPAGNGGGNGVGVTQLAADIHYIKTTGFSGAVTPLPLHKDSWFLLLQLAPIACLAGAFGYRRLRDRSEQDTGSFRGRRARGVARKRLRAATKRCKAGEADRFYSELDAGIRGFFADKFNRPASGLVVDEIVEEIRRRGIDESSALEARGLLDKCDHARFAPGASEVDAMKKAIEEAETLIASLARKM